MATEDLCLVCTDSLDYSGVGPCGHKEACSRCVARLRFVMEDSRCMLCKQDNPAVFFTRYMGDYTQSLPPQEFSKLQERTAAGELYCLPEVNGYFDDKEHYNTIKSLCSFTHPLVNGATFSSLGALKRRLFEKHQLHFCDLCIKGRKVFISEQVLYSKADLERHHRTGDDAGPLAESGFKGHPLCRFCKKRFYDGDELYRHMESSHEHCFICRKQHPNRFVYYKDYAELDGHFQADHHPCPHPNCLERKFVVFGEEQDLRRHFATEHGSEMNMSRAQRRQAMQLNIQLTYSSREEQDAAMAAAAGMARPGVVIGGGHGLARSGRGGRGGGSGMRHSHSEGAMAQALQASVDSSRAEEAARGAAAPPPCGPSSVTFSAEDFPTVSGQGSSGAAPLGTWVAAGGGPGGGSLNQEDFPALPSMSRNQRRRQRDRDRAQRSSLASRLGAAGAPIRVVNRASTAAAPTPAEAAAAAAGGSSGSKSFRHSQSAGNLLTGGGGAGGAASSGAPSAAASDEEESGGVGGFESDTAPAAAAAADHFPALPGGAAAAATQAHPAWVPVRRSGRPPKPGQAGSSSSSSSSSGRGSSRGVAPAAPNSISDFPSLAATIPARSSSSSSSRAAGKGKAASSRGGGSGIKVLSSSSSSSAAAQPPQLTVADAVAAAGGVSEQLKAANKALIERCKAALSDEGFRDFRERSAGFMQGGLSADAYHKHVVALGLLQLVPQLAALCPDADKRAALVSAHKQYLQDSSTQDSLAGGPLGSGGRAGKGWVPPEAAMAALAEAEAKGSWSCERCTLTNAPNSRSCEVCSAPRPKGDGAAAGSSSSGSSARAGAAAAGSSWSSAAGSSSKASQPQQQQQQQQSAAAQQQQQQPPAAGSWPGLPGGQKGKGKQTATAAGVQQQEQAAGSSSSAGAGSSSTQQQEQSAGGKKKKGQKQQLSELLATGKTHPQNAWSQQERLSTLVAPSGGRGSMGQWGKQGGSKLAKSINAFNDAGGRMRP